MIITQENYETAFDAIRDILFMYIDLIESYAGFGHNIDTGKFNALNFIDAYIIEPAGQTSGIDIDLLHSGSAIALLCELSNAWDEYQTSEVSIWPIISETRNANISGRFTHLPEIQAAMNAGFGKDEKEFRNQLENVYNTNVVGYFKRILNKSS